MKATRVGVVGLGDAGFTMHLPALALLSDVAIAGMVDTDSARRDLATAKYEATAYTDLNEMLAAENPEILIVATPPESHADLCVVALEHGCHVICEKPFMTSVADADRVIDAALAANRRIAVNHEFREMPIFRAVLDAVAESGREQIIFAQAWQQVDLPPSLEAGWRRAGPGRVLHEAGVHLIDYMMAMFGSPPVSVSATMSSGMKSEESDSIVSLAMQFPEGRIASVVINRLAKGENHYFDARVDMVNASYRASFGGRARLTAGLHRAKQPHMRLDYGVSGMAWKEIGSRRELIARNPSGPRMKSTKDVLARTISAFHTGGVAPCEADWAREVCRVIEAAYRSAESGRTETVVQS